MAAERLSPVEEIARLRQRRAHARRKSRRRAAAGWVMSRWRARAWRQLRGWESQSYALAQRRAAALHAGSVIAQNDARPRRGDEPIFGFPLPQDLLPADVLRSPLSVAFLGWVAHAWVLHKGAAWVSSHPQTAALLRCSVGGARRAVERLVKLGALEVCRHFTEERTADGTVERWQESNSYRPHGWFRDLLKRSLVRRARGRRRQLATVTTDQAATPVAPDSVSERGSESSGARARACSRPAGGAGGGVPSGDDPGPSRPLSVGASAARPALPPSTPVERKARGAGDAPATGPEVAAARHGSAPARASSPETETGGVSSPPAERRSSAAPSGPTSAERRASLDAELDALEREQLPIVEFVRRSNEALRRWGFAP